MFQIFQSSLNILLNKIICQKFVKDLIFLQKWLNFAKFGHTGSVVLADVEFYQTMIHFYDPLVTSKWSKSDHSLKIKERERKSPK